MSRKSLALILGTLVIVVVVGILISQNSPSSSDTSTPITASTGSGQATSAPSETTNPNSTTTTSTTTTGTTPSTGSGQATIPKPSGYTMAQVTAHNTQSSCWTAINGSVYNVTSWISQHPGGAQAIISLCGTDGSAAFNDQHGGQRRPASELASFKIGALTN